jgi:hypothetical protein
MQAAPAAEAAPETEQAEPEGTVAPLATGFEVRDEHAAEASEPPEPTDIETPFLEEEGDQPLLVFDPIGEEPSQAQGDDEAEAQHSASQMDAPEVPDETTQALEEESAVPEAPDYLKTKLTESEPDTVGWPDDAEQEYSNNGHAHDDAASEDAPARVVEPAHSANGFEPSPDEEPPESIPGEEHLSPEMARFLRSRRRDKKDSPFRGFDSPPGRF